MICDLMNYDIAPPLAFMEYINRDKHMQGKFFINMAPYTPSNYRDMIRYLKNETFDEEGYDRNFYIDICREVFGREYNTEYIKEAVRSTISHYGGADGYKRFFKNEQWAKPDGPIFLMIGGESPARPSWVLNENLTYLEFGATVYLLEHRYYGESHLFEAVGAFKNKIYTYYLSSLQMLYDVANFIRTVNTEMGTDKPAKWIVFGGSYSGSLALWMRQLFPDLVHGAVGSSAPLEAKLDFT
ncbi:hypothetical protein OSTOST_15408 [Ostertagia ostertagi]